jgi:hypothetical protein
MANTINAAVAPIHCKDGPRGRASESIFNSDFLLISPYSGPTIALDLVVNSGATIHNQAATNDKEFDNEFHRLVFSTSTISGKRLFRLDLLSILNAERGGNPGAWTVIISSKTGKRYEFTVDEIECAFGQAAVVSVLVVSRR